VLVTAVLQARAAVPQVRLFVEFFIVVAAGFVWILEIQDETLFFPSGNSPFGFSVPEHRSCSVVEVIIELFSPREGEPLNQFRPGYYGWWSLRNGCCWWRRP